MIPANTLVTDIDPQKTAEALEKLTRSSIDLAEAASNYGALKVIFGVFMVLVIIIIIIFLYQVLVLSKKVDAIHDNTTRLSKVVLDTANRTIGTTEAQILVRRSLNNFGTLLKYHIIRIKYENNITNQDMVRAKLNRVVDNNWNELHNFLSVFIYDDKPLSAVIGDGDQASVKKLVEDCIYDGCVPMNINQIDNQVSLFLEGIKITYLRHL